MRLVLLVPLTFVAGVHGFALFAPYMLLVLAVLHVRRWKRRTIGEERPAVAETPAEDFGVLVAGA